jgi:ketosteroid isomerase-like protein
MRDILSFRREPSLCWKEKKNYNSMGKYIIIILLLISPAKIFAQLDHQIAQVEKEVVQAEKNFAAYSVSHSTKEAFLRFIDSNGIVFNNGEAVNGMELWNKREKGPGVLDWYPQFAGLSASGELGFTTGPWTFKPSKNDTIAARGYYTTVWRKNKAGEWKFIVDLGVENTPPDTDTSKWWTHRTNPAVYTGSYKSMLQAEKEFMKKTKKAITKQWYRLSEYKDLRAGLFMMHRNKRSAVFDLDPLLGAIMEMPENISYTILGSGIAESGDLGYVYGTTTINGKKNNYLRIWVKESRGWKIAVEVLPY